MIELHGYLLILYTCGLSAQAAKTYCTVPHVRETERTTLTCYFPEDISLSKKDFTVYHHRDDKPTPDSVLSCLWSPDLKCFPSRGYNFDEVVTDRITVDILRVTKAETGKYTCQISGLRAEDLDHCRLEIGHAAKTYCTVPHVRESESTTLTCYFPEDISLSKKDFTVYHHRDDKPTPDSVLSCLWSPDLTCFPSSGYNFDEVVTDRITVDILRVTKAETGKYTCQISGSRAEDLDHCQLEIASPGGTTCQFHSEMSKTFLTCHFPEDISQSRSDFAVYHINGQGNRDAVVTCLWMGDKPECNSKKGFEVRDRISDRITFHIPRVTEKETGNYMCQMTKSKAGKAGLCELSDSQGKSSCEIYSKMSKTYLTCYFPQDIGQSRTDFDVYHIRDRNQDIVVRCFWMSDKLDCYSKKGFETGELLAGRITFGIPRVTENEMGTYFCLMSGSKVEEARLCELRPEEETGKKLELASLIVTPIVVILLVILVVLLILYAKWPYRNQVQSINDRTGHLEQNGAFSLDRLFSWIQRMTGTDPPCQNKDERKISVPLLRPSSDQPSDAVRKVHQHTDQTVSISIEPAGETLEEGQRTEVPSTEETQADIREWGLPRPLLDMPTNQETNKSHMPTPDQAVTGHRESCGRERLLHMDPPDSHSQGSEDGVVPKGEKKKKKKHKEARDHRIKDPSSSDGHEFAESSKDTANSEKDKERKRSWKDRLRRKKPKKDTDQATSKEDSLGKSTLTSKQTTKSNNPPDFVSAKEHGAQATSDSDSELFDQLDSDEELNARLGSFKDPMASTTQTFQRNRERKSYSPNRMTFRRDKQRTTFPQDQARLRHKSESQKDTEKGEHKLSFGPLRKPSAEHNYEATSPEKEAEGGKDRRPKKE